MDSQTLYASASFKKVPGTLSLSPAGVLNWRPSSDSSAVPPFSVAAKHVDKLKTTPPGAAQVALRLDTCAPQTINGSTAALIVFNAEKDTALEDRERFKTRLASDISKARAQGSQTPESRGGTPLEARRSETPGTPRRAGARVPDNTEVKLRGKVLLANPELLALHKEVVGSNLVPDADFWAHPAREALLRAERARMEQRHGRRGPMADPQPSQNESGELKLNLTPQLVRELFEEYPVLARAYEENVPKRLDENAFWTRYFQSKLYHRLRTSLRSAASENTLRSDDIFDKYLPEEDDGTEPRRQYDPHDALLDLASTEEDHGETGNIRDFTMRAGYDRRVLPLVRRFNEHSENVLSSMGEASEQERARVRRKTGGVGQEYPEHHHAQMAGSDYYKDIVLDDLGEREQQVGRRLEIRDQKAYFETGAPGEDAMPQDGAPAELLQQSMAKFEDELHAWTLQLSHFSADGRTMRRTLDTMLQNMEQRKFGHQTNASTELPADIYKLATSCHAATTEFLRQFWQAVTLTVQGQDASGNDTRRMSVDERVNKARRMQQTLGRTAQNINSIAEAAEAALPGNGRRLVEEAFLATRDAVARALSFRVGAG